VSDPGRMDQHPVAPSSRQSVDELVRAKGARPINSLEDLQSYAVELFDSDEEVGEFLAFVREIRNSDIS
jgi:hypothetical protein